MELHTYLKLCDLVSYEYKENAKLLKKQWDEWKIKENKIAIKQVLDWLQILGSIAKKSN
jgi:hypothetical protein